MEELINSISRLKALVNTSLAYSSDVYDRERLEEMKKILFGLSKEYLQNIPVERIENYFDKDIGYVTPKVDVRAVVFNNFGKLLLVKEKKENTWSLPGGWADVGYSPSEVAVKEVMEESGLDVTPKSLFKIIDKSKHSYPASIEYVYKLFFYCETDDYTTSTGVETSDINFFAKEDIEKLPNLSLGRNTLEDLLEAFDFHENPREGAKFD